MAMVASYEDVRRQRMEENNRKMEALGLLGLAQSLKPERKGNGPGKRSGSARKEATEARRSSRLGGKPAVSYRDQMDLMPGMRMRVGGRERQPLARRYLSDAARMAAIDAAEETYKAIARPAFVKPMLHSHTASGFWLGLPANFCKEFLSDRDERITLEDERAMEWECVYLAHKVGLSGGWRGFSLDHELVDGDCLIFELMEPRRFKVHVFRCEEEHEPENDAGNKPPPASAPPELSKGRKLSTFTRKLDLEDEQLSDASPKASKQGKKDEAGPPRSSKRRRATDDDTKDAVAKSKKQKEGDVVDLSSGEENNAEASDKPGAPRKDAQTPIRAFGRITRNSLAKALQKKFE